MGAFGGRESGAETRAGLPNGGVQGLIDLGGTTAVSDIWLNILHGATVELASVIVPPLLYSPPPACDTTHVAA